MNPSPLNTASHPTGISADVPVKNRRGAIPQGRVLWLSLLFWGVCSVALGMSIDMDKVALIESSRNPNAGSYKGWKSGVGYYQISDITRRHFNEVHHTKISTDDLSNRATNERIATWYIEWLSARPHTKTAFDVLCSYNWGYTNFVRWKKRGADWSELPEESREYWNVYKKL